MAGLSLWLAALTGGVITSAFSIFQRLTKMETTLDLIGMKAANVLHSPHTPELDRLLEKYVSREYELTLDEWKELNDRCEAIENDTSNPKDQRALAAIVSALCHHKMRQAPPKFKSHYEN